MTKWSVEEEECVRRNRKSMLKRNIFLSRVFFVVAQLQYLLWLIRGGVVLVGGFLEVLEERLASWTTCTLFPASRFSGTDRSKYCSHLKKLCRYLEHDNALLFKVFLFFGRQMVRFVLEGGGKVDSTDMFVMRTTCNGRGAVLTATRQVRLW